MKTKSALSQGVRMIKRIFSIWMPPILVGCITPQILGSIMKEALEQDPSFWVVLVFLLIIVIVFVFAIWGIMAVTRDYPEFWGRRTLAWAIAMFVSMAYFFHQNPLP